VGCPYANNSLLRLEEFLPIKVPDPFSGRLSRQQVPALLPVSRWQPKMTRFWEDRLCLAAQSHHNYARPRLRNTVLFGVDETNIYRITSAMSGLNGSIEGGTVCRMQKAGHVFKYESLRSHGTEDPKVVREQARPRVVQPHPTVL